MDRSLLYCAILALAIVVVFTAGCGGHTNSNPTPSISHSASARAQSRVSSSETTSELSSGPADSSGTPASDANGNLGGSAHHYVYLTWKASISHVLGYNIYRGPSSAGPFQRVNAQIEPATVYTDYGVAAGKRYYYVVTAVGDKEESVYSAAVLAIIPYP